MEISNIQNSPNFRARIVIQKTGFKNLGEDIIDSFELSSLSGASSGSATTETTIFPSDIVKGGKFANYINKCIDGMKETFAKIFNRNIKTSELEGIDVKEVAGNSTITASGAGSVSTGLGSYDYAMASALDQSIHYPNSSYPACIPEFIENHFPESVVNHSANRVDSVYDRLWDPRNSAGNELASTQSSVWSTFGAGSQGIGFEMMTKGGKAFETFDKALRKLPS